MEATKEIKINTASNNEEELKKFEALINNIATLTTDQREKITLIVEGFVLAKTGA